MKFSYDPQTDTAYQAYAAQLAAQSDTEKKNTLGLLAKRTGGLPSSYAVGAVKAVGDNYAAKAAQAQQTYRQAALDVFNENYNQRNTLLKTLLSLREAEEDAYYKQLEAETARLKALYSSRGKSSSSGRTTVYTNGSSQTAVANPKYRQDPSEKSYAYDKALDLIRRNKASGGSKASAESYINQLYNDGKLTKAERTELWNVIDDWKTLGAKKGKRKEDLQEWKDYMYRVTGREFL